MDKFGGPLSNFVFEGLKRIPQIFLALLLLGHILGRPENLHDSRFSFHRTELPGEDNPPQRAIRTDDATGELKPLTALPQRLDSRLESGDIIRVKELSDSLKDTSSQEWRRVNHLCREPPRRAADARRPTKMLSGLCAGCLSIAHGIKPNHQTQHQHSTINQIPLSHCIRGISLLAKANTPDAKAPSTSLALPARCFPSCSGRIRDWLYAMLVRPIFPRVLAIVVAQSRFQCVAQLLKQRPHGGRRQFHRAQLFSHVLRTTHRRMEDSHFVSLSGTTTLQAWSSSKRAIGTNKKAEQVETQQSPSAALFSCHPVIPDPTPRSTPASRRD